MEESYTPLLLSEHLFLSEYLEAICMNTEPALNEEREMVNIDILSSQIKGNIEDPE